LLRSLGVTHEVIDATRARWIEPALNLAKRLHAAVHLPQDGVGNCRQFAQLLKSQAQKLGASSTSTRQWRLCALAHGPAWNWQRRRAAGLSTP
jgi:glycine/D-amino acid oxidase-like deaminating enzyme